MIRNLKYKWRNLVTGIRNLIKWAPIIYRDRNWDHWFIYEMLKTKLQHQADYFLKHGHLENSVKYAEQMLKCIEMINVVQNEKIIDDYLFSIDPYGNEEELNWNKLKEIDQKQQQAKEDLFKFLEQNIEHWWD